MKFSQNSPRYALKPHISVCRTADYAVILDCKNGRYLGVQAEEAIAVASCISGWPYSPEQTSGSPLAQNPEAVELLDHMIESGMLAPEVSFSAPSPLMSVDPPTVDLIEGYAAVPFRLDLKDIARFLVSALIAHILLLGNSFQPLANRLRRRRTRNVIDCKHFVDTPDMNRTRVLVAKFNLLFRLLFPSRNACLLQSVALSEFLFRNGIFSNCVLGVVTNPFAAHCWVQQGVVVLNDSAAAVRKFTPILVL